MTLKALAIIPARGGSKRIPQKNIRPFLGKPIIAYSIQAAMESGLFEEVMVSTDDETIAEIGKSYGAKVPFLRSIKNSDDFATTADVIAEVLADYEKLGREFDLVCCIYPTAPFVSASNLKQSLEILIEKKFSSVFPVVKFSHPIQRALEIKDGNAFMIEPGNMGVRSQDLKATYHDAGQYYWLKVNSFKQARKLFMENSGAITVDELQVQDIDNETDWKLAEMKYSLLQRQ